MHNLASLYYMQKFIFNRQVVLSHIHAISLTRGSDSQIMFAASIGEKRLVLISKW